MFKKHTEIIPSASQNTAVIVEDLTVAYHSKPVVWDADITVPAGVLMAIVGPNGAGKSTLIKAMLNMVPKAAGSITILGKNYKSAQHMLGYVPQRELVDWDFPTTVLDVVTMGLYGKLGLIRRPSRREKETAMHAIEQTGLTDYAHRQIGQLSGGQQQRTFLARALAQDAAIYLMDEPFAAVDALTERAIVTVLHHMKQQGKTVIAVHHDLQTIPEYFDYVTLMNVEIIASGSTQNVFTTENIRLTYSGNISHATMSA